VLVEARDEAVVADLLAGRRSMCFGLSEPDSGSDAWGMKTSAVRDGDEWRITGTKQWTTNGPSADVCLVFAVTDAERAKLRRGGVSAFLVPTDTPGFSVDSVITLFGHIGGDEAILSFDDVRVPAAALVGEVDSGFTLALKAVNEGRLYNCGRAIGLARWCLDQAVDYAKQRRTFDRPIADYQAIQWHLADSATELYAARCMTLDCARRLERGERAIKELSMSKLMATEAGCRAIDRCTLVLGAMGLTSEMRFYDAWQQVRTVRIAEGSGEILRRTIAGRLLQGDLSL
jgi:acyl-CoA dehydrogenase